jgi:hypothetical protein
VAANLYDCGSDGLYVFNFPCWTEYLAARPYHWLEGLDDPKTAAKKPLLVAVPHHLHRIPNVDLPGQLPADLPAGLTLNLTLYAAEAALPARRALLLVHSGGDVSLAVNGVPGRPLPQLSRSEIFGEYVDQAVAGRRPAKENCRVFQADPSALTAGLNKIALVNATDKTLSVERVNLGVW